MDLKVATSWKDILIPEFDKQYFRDLIDYIELEYKNHLCFPQKQAIFAAFDFCSFKDLKVVIIGQDPYHNKNQANGLCFSVKEGVPHPPSLQNIFKEIASDLKQEYSTSGDLSHWAKQGVLLLNATLTVRAHKAASHQNKGWEIFTDAIIQQISERKEHIVFLLWGGYAKKKRKTNSNKKTYRLYLRTPVSIECK